MSDALKWLSTSDLEALQAGDMSKVSTAGLERLQRETQKPAAVEAGQAVNSIPRQIGLTARYGLEGLANTAQIVTEPIRYLQDMVTPERDMKLSDLITGEKRKPKSMPLGAVASQFADYIGLPKPEGANERVIGDATRLVAGAGGMGGAASLARNAPGALGQAGTFLSAKMPQQLASAAGAGLAGGASREAGGGALMQAGAALLGGVGAGTVPGFATSAASVARNTLARPNPAALDQQISVLLQRADVDYSQFPVGVRNALRNDVAGAMRIGQQLDPQAVARLAAFRLTNTTPTRGMVSQDPVQITREMNLAKIGANSSDTGLHGLPLLQNRNNSQLIQNLNQGGATQGDPFRAGQAAIGGIQGRDAALGQGVTQLYQQARDTSGRSLPLDGAAFATRANQALDEGLLGGALPQDVATHMNRIARGEVPFTVDYAEQLKTRIAALQRASSDGSSRMALSTVRQALDDTPLMQAPQVNPGNLPAVPGTVPPSPSIAGRESIDAFNAARAAARQRFGWQESSRPVEAALNGAQPDRFVQQFVLRGTVADAEAVAQNAPIAEVKNAIVLHLKEKALNGASDEVGKFSQSAFNKALNEIGQRKLSLFFSPEEITALRANARVSSLMQVQPVGSAVNNSNSGALLLGKGYDALMNLGSKVPVLGPMLVPPVRNIEISMRNRQAQNVLPGLLAHQEPQPMGQSLLLPSIAMGGLLAAP